ncbi:hypothetical protein [Burkholderia stabilis]
MQLKAAGSGSRRVDVIRPSTRELPRNADIAGENQGSESLAIRIETGCSKIRGKRKIKCREHV